MAYSVTVDEYAAITVTGGKHSFALLITKIDHFFFSAHGTFLGDTYKNFSTGIAMQASTTESTSTGIVELIFEFRSNLSNCSSFTSNKSLKIIPILMGAGLSLSPRLQYTPFTRQ